MKQEAGQQYTHFDGSKSKFLFDTETQILWLFNRTETSHPYVSQELG